MSLMKNTSCSIDAAAVLLACKPEVIQMALENRDLVACLYKRIQYLEKEIVERDEKVIELCNNLNKTISQKYQYE
jgi:hypothetical protein